MKRPTAMKPLLSLALLCACGLAAAQVKLTDPAHGATLVFERKQDGGVIVETQRWQVSGTFSRLLESTYSKDGALTKQKVAARDTIREAVISATGAAVTVMAKATRRTNIPLARGGSLVDPSVLWFTGSLPTKDTAATFMSFDAERSFWEEVKVMYLGRGRLGDSPEGHLITRQTARKSIRLLLDDKGLPLVWEENRLRLVRAK